MQNFPRNCLSPSQLPIRDRHDVIGSNWSKSDRVENLGGWPCELEENAPPFRCWEMAVVGKKKSLISEKFVMIVFHNNNNNNFITIVFLTFGEEESLDVDPYPTSPPPVSQDIF